MKYLAAAGEEEGGRRPRPRTGRAEELIIHAHFRRKSFSFMTSLQSLRSSAYGSDGGALGSLRCSNNAAAPLMRETTDGRRVIAIQRVGGGAAPRLMKGARWTSPGEAAASLGGGGGGGGASYLFLCSKPDWSLGHMVGHATGAATRPARPPCATPPALNLPHGFWVSGGFLLPTDGRRRHVASPVSPAWRASPMGLAPPPAWLEETERCAPIG